MMNAGHIWRVAFNASQYAVGAVWFVIAQTIPAPADPLTWALEKGGPLGVLMLAFLYTYFKLVPQMSKDNKEAIKTLAAENRAMSDTQLSAFTSEQKATRESYEKRIQSMGETHEKRVDQLLQLNRDREK